MASASTQVVHSSSPLSLTDEQIEQVKSWFSWNDLMLSTNDVSSSTTANNNDNAKFSMKVEEVSSSSIKLILSKCASPTTFERGSFCEESNITLEPVAELVLSSQDQIKSLLIATDDNCIMKPQDMPFAMYWNFILRSCFGNLHPHLIASVHTMVFLSEEEMNAHRKKVKSSNKCCSTKFICTPSWEERKDEISSRESIPVETCLHCRPIFKVLFIDEQSKSTFSFPFRAIDPLGLLYGQICDMKQEILTLQTANSNNE